MQLSAYARPNQLQGGTKVTMTRTTFQVVCAVFLLGGSAVRLVAIEASAVEAQAGASPFEEFEAIQASYFPMLDLRVSRAQRAAIPQFAARISLIADDVRRLQSQGAIQDQNHLAIAGLVFIYDALMTLNNTYAALDGVFALDALTSARRFADQDASDRDELMARSLYALSELDDAAILRPDDRRIDSWRAAINTSIEKIQTGSVSDATLAQVLDTIDARPTFNLWTALLMFQGKDASTALLGRLVDAAKSFVDSTNDGTDPCSVRPQDCQNGPHAPYNFQSSVVVLGDAFLRRANHLLQAGDVAGAMPLAFYAQGTYRELQAPSHLPDTQNWPDRAAISVRDAAVEGLLNAQPFDDATLIEADAYLRAYECSACHGRAAQ